MFAKLPPAAHPCPILGKHPFHPRAHRGPRVAPPASPPHPAKSAAPPPVSRRASAGRQTGRDGPARSLRLAAPAAASAPTADAALAPARPDRANPRRPRRPLRRRQRPRRVPRPTRPMIPSVSLRRPPLVRPCNRPSPAPASRPMTRAPSSASEHALRRGMGTGAVFWSRSMPEGVRRAIPWLGERTARGRPAGDAASPSFPPRASVNQPFLPARSPAGR